MGHSLAARLLNHTQGFDFLAVEAEKQELAYVGVTPIKLQYIGKQECPGMEPIRLWNILAEGHPFNHSTRSLDGLKELGVI